MPTVAETICEISRKHVLENNGQIWGQCLTAVGWIGGTIPELTEKDGLVEAPMADVAWPGLAVGAALAGRRPIIAVRYQGFQTFNHSFIVNYAAKSKEMWGIPCPLFVRSIAMDGAIGPVASGSHASLFTRMPGVPVCAPFPPREYESVWDYFMEHDDPLYVSEHRRSFPIDYEMENVVYPDADVALFAISATRLNAVEAVLQMAKKRIVCSLVHVLWLKPFAVTEDMHKALARSRFGGIVLDGDYENGTAKSLAFDLMHATGKRVHVLGLEERTAGFAPHLDTLPPTTERICAKVREIMDKR